VTDYRTLLVEQADDVVTIWMNQPERRNVMSPELMLEMTRALNEIGESDVKGVIVAGKGKVFSAGHDFRDLYDQDLASVRQLFTTCTRMMQAVQSIPQPVVARVHALATGAGCQLVASADLAVASREATFCTPGGLGGLFCTTPMVAVGRNIGRKRALEMAMSGEPIDANTALAWGLINRLVPVEELQSATAELLRRVTRGSPASKGIGKLAFYEQIGLDQSEAYFRAVEVMARASQIPDAQEGFESFLEKRPAKWLGRPPEGLPEVFD
jgi:enoyl-CoA hydratase/carnithine racemase